MGLLFFSLCKGCRRLPCLVCFSRFIESGSWSCLCDVDALYLSFTLLRQSPKFFIGAYLKLSFFPCPFYLKAVLEVFLFFWGLFGRNGFCLLIPLFCYRFFPGSAVVLPFPLFPLIRYVFLSFPPIYLFLLSNLSRIGSLSLIARYLWRKSVLLGFCYLGIVVLLYYLNFSIAF